MAIQRRDLRASDGDREQTVAQLKTHYAAGRLADHELAARSEAAYRSVGMRELRWLVSDLPREVQRRRRHVPVWPLVVLVAVIAAWLVTVPPEVTLALTLVFVVFALLAVVLLSPLWIPALLAFLAYRLLRTR
jgi:DUF1707 SHOCT-like domain